MYYSRWHICNHIECVSQSLTAAITHVLFTHLSGLPVTFGMTGRPFRARWPENSTPSMFLYHAFTDLRLAVAHSLLNNMPAIVIELYRRVTTNSNPGETSLVTQVHDYVSTRILHFQNDPAPILPLYFTNDNSPTLPLRLATLLSQCGHWVQTLQPPYRNLNGK